jgi:hypothetical protein
MTRAQRLTRLEARRPPVVNDVTPPEIPPGYWEEVWRIVWEHGLFASREDMLEQCAGLTNAASSAALPHSIPLPYLSIIAPAALQDRSRESKGVLAVRVPLACIGSL